MTDIEMNVTHNSKEEGKDKLDAHSDSSNDNTNMETQDTDPLALDDDDEKMDVDEPNTNTLNIAVQKEILKETIIINDESINYQNSKTEAENNGDLQLIASNNVDTDQNGCTDLEDNSKSTTSPINSESCENVETNKEDQICENNVANDKEAVKCEESVLLNLVDPLSSEIENYDKSEKVIEDANASNSEQKSETIVKDNSQSDKSVLPVTVDNKCAEDVVSASPVGVDSSNGDSSGSSGLSNGSADKTSDKVVEDGKDESHSCKEELVDKKNIPIEDSIVSAKPANEEKTNEITLVVPKEEIVENVNENNSLKQNGMELVKPNNSNNSNTNIRTSFLSQLDPLKSLKNAMNRHILNASIKEEEVPLEEHTDLEKELPASIVSVNDDRNLNRLHDGRDHSSEESDSDDQALHIVEENATQAESVNIKQINKKNRNKSKRTISETERSRSDENPSKKLCRELEESYEQHNAMLANYIASTSNSTVEEIDMHTEALETEIETLKELAQNREREWNNILHLKKVKEEILLRLIRKKSIILLEKVNHDINESKKAKNNKNCPSSSSQNIIPDRFDDLPSARMTKSPSSNTNKPVYISSTAVAMPITTTPYCPISMLNYPLPLDKNIHYYGNKKIVPKPTGLLGNSRNIYDKNGQLESFMMPMGRQGPTKDVQSIIADYRNRHPETVPRRGRRLRSIVNPQSPQVSLGPRPIAPNPSDHSMDLGMFLSRMENNPHMSVTETMASQHNPMLQQIPTSLPNGMSFKDVLVQFTNGAGQSGNNGIGGNLPPPPPYPEVTLHPVGNTVKVTPMPQAQGIGNHGQQNQQLSQLAVGNQQNNSLLHGILTKQQPKHQQQQQQPQDNRFSTFSPTLARLLTAPEKSTPSTNTATSTGYTAQSKNCMEITITPVPPTNQSSISRVEPEVVHLDDYEDPELEEDSAERPLVIDEEGADKESGAVELNESEVPECQGCHRKEAQFVCAGCANQWYCSRECQVSAWDEHSEMCSG